MPNLLMLHVPLLLFVTWWCCIHRRRYVAVVVVSLTSVEKSDKDDKVENVTLPWLRLIIKRCFLLNILLI